jgi:hypothetical protein
LNFIQQLIEKAKSSPTQLPTRINIPLENVDNKKRIGSALSKDLYFQIRINELFLKDKRNWYKQYAPMLFVVSEFSYCGEKKTVPFIVGPQMMDKFGKSLPDDMLFLNTKVAGLHPFRGGQITLSIILYQYEIGNYLEKMLRTLESTANIFSFATSFSTYMKIAGVLFEGVESLLSLQNLNPLTGLRIEMSQDADDLNSGYFVLINSPEGSLDQNKFWIKNNQLYFGSSSAESKPFREADYTLYSILHDESRSDYTELPFYSQWSEVMKDATDGANENAEVNMSSFTQALLSSPDLTFKHALALVKQFGDDLDLIKKLTPGEGKRGSGTEAETRIDEIRSLALKRLKKS